MEEITVVCPVCKEPAPAYTGAGGDLLTAMLRRHDGPQIIGNPLKHPPMCEGSFSQIVRETGEVMETLQASEDNPEVEPPPGVSGVWNEPNPEFRNHEQTLRRAKIFAAGYIHCMMDEDEDEDYDEAAYTSLGDMSLGEPGAVYIPVDRLTHAFVRYEKALPESDEFYQAIAAIDEVLSLIDAEGYDAFYWGASGG